MKPVRTRRAWPFCILPFCLLRGVECAAGVIAPPAKLQIPGVNASGIPWTIVLLLTLLTLLPALMLSMTPLVRLLVVFHFLRQALGTQSAPTNQTLIGLSLVLTYFLMQPVVGAIYQQAIVPLEQNQITPWESLDRGSEPLRHFMLKFVRENVAATNMTNAEEARQATVQAAASMNNLTLMDYLSSASTA